MGRDACSSVTGSIGLRLCFVAWLMCGTMQQAGMAAGNIMDTTVIGTYGYMAPEQLQGAAEPASDLYGLGGTLVLLLTGTLTHVYNLPDSLDTPSTPQRDTTHVVSHHTWYNIEGIRSGRSVLTTCMMFSCQPSCS